MLVRFIPDQERALQIDLEEELELMLGRNVDFIDADSVTNPFVRKHIREHRVRIYAA